MRVNNADDGKKVGQKTVVVGATANPGRYAYKAIHLLQRYDHPIALLGLRKGEVDGVPIDDIRGRPPIEGVDTITMYVNPGNQADYETYLLSMKPRRIIFNPGAENDAFAERAEALGIETVYGCTMVMLRTGQF